MSDAYEVVIGLEVHAQLRTRTKMFCGCSTAFGAPPNTQTCPVCQGMPGTLPVINRRAVEFGIKTALAINCTVNADNRFARKHYYYPDMPKNYQISQYEEPLAEHGYLDIEGAGASRRIGIQRLHLEEDVGKLVHEGSLETAQSSQVDFNRAGVPLMEIVSMPDGHTVSMRSKEFAHDYRYFPEPDLPPLDVASAWIEQVRATLPELPAARRQRFTKVYALSAYDADVATQSKGLADYFEAAAQGSANPKTVANWVLNEVLRVVPPDDEQAIAACPVKPAALAGLIALIEDGTISGRMAKDVFEKMLASGESARAIVSREGLTQVADADALGTVVDRVLAEHAKVVEDYKAGKKAALGFLVGQVMKSTSGKASPAVVNSLLMEKLPKV